MIRAVYFPFRIIVFILLSTSSSQHGVASCWDFPSSNEPARLLTQSCRRGGEARSVGVAYFVLLYPLFIGYIVVLYNINNSKTKRLPETIFPEGVL